MFLFSINLLEAALPALEAAEASLKSLNKNDISEVRTMQRPPFGVRVVIEAICIVKGIKPNRVKSLTSSQFPLLLYTNT